MKRIFIASVLLPGIFAFAGIVGNGSFEEGMVGGIPAGWNFSAGKAEARMTVDDGGYTDGRRALLIRNTSSKKPNVYGMLFRPVRLQPNIRYILSCDIMGLNARGITFVVGNSWRVRLRPPQPVLEWKHYKAEFILSEKELNRKGETMLRILTEDLADVARIDNLHIRPADGSVCDSSTFRSERLFLLPRVSEFPASGIPAGFPIFRLPEDADHCTAASLWDGRRFSADFSLGHSNDGLWLFFDVKKPSPEGGKGAGLWNSDSIQFRFSPSCSFDGSPASGDTELGFSPAGDGVRSWNWSARRELSSAEAESKCTITPTGYRLTIKLKPQLPGVEAILKRRIFSFNAVVNVIDGGKRQAAFLEHGIHNGKSNRYNILGILETDVPTAFLKAVSTRNPRSLSGMLYLAGFSESTPWSLKAEMADSAGNIVSIPVNNLPALSGGRILMREVKFPLAKLAEGQYRLRFLAQDKICGELYAVKQDLLAKQLPALAAAEKRLAELGEIIRRNRLESRYLSVPAALLEQKIREQKQYLTQKQSSEAQEHFLRLGEIAIPEIDRELDALAVMVDRCRQGVSLPDTWVAAGNTVQACRNGIPVIKVRNEKGETRFQPHFYLGYGHFDDARRDIGFFPEIAADIVQLEIGPRDIFPVEGKTGEFSEPTDRIFRSRIESAMKKAQENHVKLALLLSPHYHPAWWLAKHPELKAGNGMHRFELNAPETRKMLAAYLDYLIPLLRGSRYADALHSLVLSNEPVYYGANWKNPFTREQFLAHLNRKYGTAEAFNRAAGTNYSSFDDILADSPETPAVRYAFHSFRFDALAEFHSFLAAKVREHFPEARLSVKIMMGTQPKPLGVEFASEPERTAWLSDYNGNDNYMTFRGSRYISDWLPTAFGHDLQYSLRPLPILNSENHIISDGETGSIPPEHIYTALFEQLLQGAGGLITWVWAENTYERYRKEIPLRNSIYHRPSNIIAHSRAALDGNRLAEEILDFVAAKPEVALLYATSSQIQNPERYCRSLQACYEMLSFTGRKIGFISEKQLAAGKFGKLKIIILTDATHLDEAAARSLSEFSKRGGVLLNVGEPPAFNSFGARLAVSPAMTRLPSSPGLREWLKQLDSLPPLPVRLDPVTPGVLFRAVPAGEGTYLINIVNYTHQPQKLKLTGEAGAIFDLVARRPHPMEFKLAPLHPLFLRFSR